MNQARKRPTAGSGYAAARLSAALAAALAGLLSCDPFEPGSDLPKKSPEPEPEAVAAPEGCALHPGTKLSGRYTLKSTLVAAGLGFEMDLELVAVMAQTGDIAAGDAKFNGELRTPGAAESEPGAKIPETAVAGDGSFVATVPNLLIPKEFDPKLLAADAKVQVIIEGQAVRDDLWIGVITVKLQDAPTFAGNVTLDLVGPFTAVNEGQPIPADPCGKGAPEPGENPDGGAVSTDGGLEEPPPPPAGCLEQPKDISGKFGIKGQLTLLEPPIEGVNVDLDLLGIFTQAGIVADGTAMLGGELRSASKPDEPGAAFADVEISATGEFTALVPDFLVPASFSELLKSDTPANITLHGAILHSNGIEGTLDVEMVDVDSIAGVLKAVKLSGPFTGRRTDHGGCTEEKADGGLTVEGDGGQVAGTTDGGAT